MTAVHPLFVVDVSDDKPIESCVTKRRKGSAVDVASSSTTSSPDMAGVDAAKKEYWEDSEDDEDMRLPDEVYADRAALSETLHPLTTVLTVFGLYFNYIKPEAPDAVNSHSGDLFNSQQSGTWSKTEPESKKSKLKQMLKNWSWTKFYATLVLLMLWGNVLRFFLVFNPADQFVPVLVNKLTTLASLLLSAINHTSCYMACHSGRLHRILREFRVTEKYIEKYKKTAKVGVGVGITAFALNVIFVAATIFIKNSRFDYVYAPFFINIPIADTDYWSFYIIKVSYFIFSIYLVAAWMLPQALSHRLAMLMFDHFRLLSNRFGEAINDTGSFNGSLRTFRRRHQAICRSVKRADHFIMIAYVAGFSCHMFTVILYLYSVIFYTSTDILTNMAFYFYLFFNIGGLVLTTANGIMVNEMAHHIRERIHNIDLSKLTSKENNELNMFQRRLTGQPIGFSVLGIFVISRKTVLSLLGLLITYFLLIVKMYKKPTQPTSNCRTDVTTSETWYTTSSTSS